MCALPLSTFGILVTLYGLLGTPDNLELRKRKGVAGLTFNNVGLAGLVGDIDAGLTCDAASNDALCTGHLQRSLRRDLRTDLRGDLAVLLCPRALRARREELFILCLVELLDKLFNHFSM